MKDESHWDIIYFGGHSGAIFTEKILVPLNSESKAIFIEPVENLIKKLIENCNNRYRNNKFVFLNKAGSDSIKTLTLFTPDINIRTVETESEYIQNGWVAWSDQLTSIHKEHVKDHLLNLPIKEIQVETVSLNYLIEQYNIKNLDLLCIDTEGHDFEILYSLNFDKLKPKKIIFEHKHIEGTNKPLGTRYKQLLLKLFSYNYVIFKVNTEDTWLELVE